MARTMPPGEMLWAAVQLKLSFDPQKELDMVIEEYCSHLDAIDRDAGRGVNSDQQAAVDAQEKIESVGGKRTRVEAAENCVRATRARTRGDKARSNGFTAAKTGAKTAPTGRNVQAKARSDLRPASTETQPAGTPKDRKLKNGADVALADVNMACEDAQLNSQSEAQAIVAEACHESNPACLHREGDGVLGGLGEDLETGILAPTSATCSKRRPQCEPQAEEEELPVRFVLQEIAEEADVAADGNSSRNEMQGEDGTAGREVDNDRCEDEQNDKTGTPCVKQHAANKDEFDVNTGGGFKDRGPQAEPETDNIVQPEQPVEESPSLGMPAPDVCLEDPDGTSENEDWLDSGDDVDDPDVGDTAHLNRDEHDLPCADASEAHVVDLAPEESPSPLPPGVWDDNPGSDTSISLPQLAGGRASRDSTPRMFAGGMEGHAAHGVHRSARRSPQAAPLADLQSQLHQLRASAVATKTSRPTKEGGKDETGFRGTLVPKPTGEAKLRSAGSKAAGHMLEREGDAQAMGTKVPSEGINFFNGGMSLLKKMREQEMSAAAIPASGNHGKPVIKAIQAAEKVRLQEERDKEKREAQKKAVQDIKAANKAQKALQTGAAASAKGTGPPPLANSNKRAVVGMTAPAPTPKPVAPSVVPAPPAAAEPPVAASAPNVTPEKPALDISDTKMCNVTPSRLRHDLATKNTTPDNTEQLKQREVQYAVTPYSQRAEVSEEESGTAKMSRAIKERPAWALKENVVRAAKQQMRWDPAKILGPFSGSCDLMDLFGKNLNDTTDIQRKIRYAARRDSKDWGPDTITLPEIERYNDLRGFRPLQELD